MCEGNRLQHFNSIEDVEKIEKEFAQNVSSAGTRKPPVATKKAILSYSN